MGSVKSVGEVRVRTVEPSKTGELSAKHVAITLFVIALLLGATTIALWKTGSVSLEVVYALGGISGALYVGAMIAAIVTYCKETGFKKVEVKGRGKVAPKASPHVEKEKERKAIITSFQNQGKETAKRIRAFNPSQAQLEEFLFSASQTKRFDISFALIQEFGFATKTVCELYKKAHHSNLSVLERELVTFLETAISKDEVAHAQLIYQAFSETGVLEIQDFVEAFRAKATKCVGAFLDHYRNPLPPQIIKAFSHHGLKDDERNALAHLISMHNERRLNEIIPKLLKEDKNDELLQLIDALELSPHMTCGGRMVLRMAAEAGAKKCVKALVAQIKDKKVIYDKEYLKQFDQEIREELEKVTVS